MFCLVIGLARAWKHIVSLIYRPLLGLYNVVLIFYLHWVTFLLVLCDQIFSVWPPQLLSWPASWFKHESQESNNSVSNNFAKYCHFRPGLSLGKFHQHLLWLGLLFRLARLSGAEVLGLAPTSTGAVDWPTGWQSGGRAKRTRAERTLPGNEVSCGRRRLALGKLRRRGNKWHLNHNMEKFEVLLKRLFHGTYNSTAFLR